MLMVYPFTSFLHTIFWILNKFLILVRIWLNSSLLTVVRAAAEMVNTRTTTKGLEELNGPDKTRDRNAWENRRRQKMYYG